MKKSIFFVICISLLTANGLFAQLKLIKATSAPPNCSFTSLYENDYRLGYLTAAPFATLHIYGNNTLIPGFAVTSNLDFTNGSYIKLLQGDMGIYQHNTATTSYNYFTSKSIFTNNLGIGAFTSSALPTAPLHLKGSTFLMEPGNNTAMKLKNNSTNGYFEFWIKYDNNATKTLVESSMFRIDADGISSSKGSITNLAAGGLNVSNILTANNIIAGTGIQTPALRLPTGAVSNYLLKTDAAGNASWADPSTMFPQLNLWQQNGNGTIYTAADAVGIGTTEMDDYMLAVNGMIGCKEVKVEVSNSIWGSWPDYVFEPSYQLPHLSEVETYININKHLPDVPSAKEVSEQGLAVGQMQATLLKKVEELTLYIIDQQKSLESQQKLIEQQGKELQELKKAVKQ